MEMQDAIYFECPYCGERFKNLVNLSGHKGAKHRDKVDNEKVRMHVCNTNLYTNLDITNKELADKRAAHSNRCDICGKYETANTSARTKDTPNRLCVDHEHKSSRFRGFLCVQCNRNLGWYEKYKDSIIKHCNFENAR